MNTTQKIKTKKIAGKISKKSQVKPSVEIWHSNGLDYCLKTINESEIDYKSKSFKVSEAEKLIQECKYIKVKVWSRTYEDQEIKSLTYFFEDMYLTKVVDYLKAKGFKVY